MAEDLEAKVKSKESKGWAKKAWDWGFGLAAATATTALSVATVGSLGIAVGAAFASGGFVGSYFNKEDKRTLGERLLGSLNVYSAVNAVIYPMVILGNLTFPLITNNTFAGVAARSLYAATAYNAAFVASFKSTEYLLQNKLNPVGMIDHVSDNFFKLWMRIGIGFFPGYALAANGVHSLTLAGMTMPPFVWNAVPVGMYNSAFPLPKAKKASKPEHTPSPAQYAPAPSPA